MAKYLAGVLTVIAAGVLLIAYGLLSPRASAFGYPDQYQSGMQPAYGAQPAYASGLQYGNPYMANGMVAMPVSAVQPVRAVQTVQAAPVVSRRATVQRVDRAPRRNWTKTALIIGGSSATGAGIGGLAGGKKGALIGAALGGGISTIYETTKDR